MDLDLEKLECFSVVWCHIVFMYSFHCALTALRLHFTNARPFCFVLILNEMQNNAWHHFEFLASYPDFRSICCVFVRLLLLYIHINAYVRILRFFFQSIFILFAGIWHLMDMVVVVWGNGSNRNRKQWTNRRKRYGDFKLNDNSAHIEKIWRENACSTRLNERCQSRRALNNICDNFE